MSSSFDVSTFQGLILALQQFWSEQGCVIIQPLDLEGMRRLAPPYSLPEEKDASADR